MTRPPKKERKPLRVQRLVTRWIGESGAMPAQTVAQHEAILDDLLRAAKHYCHAEPAMKAHGLLVFQKAAHLIAELEAQHFYKVKDARGKRMRKASRAAVVLVMARFRETKPEQPCKEFVRYAEGLDMLKVRDHGGCTDYAFQLDLFEGVEFELVGGEYVVRSLRAMWAEAGRAAKVGKPGKKSG